MITKKEDMSPEQLEAFNAAMAFARVNTRSILLGHILVLIGMTAVNVVICKYFISVSEGRFFLYFFTALLLVMSCNGDLMEESDRFRQEVQDILDNKN